MACEKCQSGFSDFDHLVNHMKNHHGRLNKMHSDLIKEKMGILKPSADLLKIKNGTYKGDAVFGLKVMNGYKNMDGTISKRKTKVNESNCVLYQQFTSKPKLIG